MKSLVEAFNFSGKKQLILIIITFFIIIGAQLPNFYNMYFNKNTGEDAAMYLETAKNFAEGKGYYCSIKNHIKDKKKLKEYIKNNGVVDRLEWIPPLYILSCSGIYSMFGIEHYPGNIFLMDLFFLIVLLILFTSYLLKHFKNLNIFFILFCLLYVGFHAEFFISHPIEMEILYNLMFFLAFLYHIKIIEYNKLKVHNYIIYALLLSAFCLVKYSAIPFVAAFLFYFLYKKRYTDFFILSILVALLVSPWMIYRSYEISGHPLAQLIRGTFPFEEVPANSGDMVTGKLRDIYVVLVAIITTILNYFKLELLFIIMPFSILYFVKNKVDKHALSVILIAIFSFVFYVLILHRNLPRYQFPLVFILLPYGIMTMSEYFNSKKHVGRIALLFILLVSIAGQILNSAVNTNRIWQYSKQTTALVDNSLDLLDKSNIPENSVLLATTTALNVYSDLKIVRGQRGMNYYNKYEILKIYNIDYVLYNEGNEIVSEDIFTDLDLVAISENDPGLKLYAVKN